MVFHEGALSLEFVNDSSLAILFGVFAPKGLLFGWFKGKPGW